MTKSLATLMGLVLALLEITVQKILVGVFKNNLRAAAIRAGQPADEK